jgi:hypothetical protein
VVVAPSHSLCSGTGPLRRLSVKTALPSRIAGTK